MSDRSRRTRTGRSLCNQPRGRGAPGAVPHRTRLLPDTSYSSRHLPSERPTRLAASRLHDAVQSASVSVRPLLSEPARLAARPSWRFVGRCGQAWGDAAAQTLDASSSPKVSPRMDVAWCRGAGPTIGAADAPQHAATAREKSPAAAREPTRPTDRHLGKEPLHRRLSGPRLSPAKRPDEGISQPCPCTVVG